jgi:hypothetical protein
VLAQDDGGIVAVVLGWGAGRVVVLADSYPLTNHGLTSADNAPFIVRIVEALSREAGGAATVAFDEHYHGFQKPTAGAVAVGEFATTPLGLAALQALVVLVGWLYLSGRRFGRPVTERHGQRRSELEFVEALAEASRRAGGARLALRSLRRHFQHTVADALGLGFSSETHASGLMAMLKQRDPDLARQVRQALLDATEVTISSRTSDALLVKVARQFDRLEREIVGGDRGSRRRGTTHPG